VCCVLVSPVVVLCAGFTDCYKVLGGYGYVGEYQVERLWRDAKLLEIGGGTLEAHQKNMTSDLCKMDDLSQVGL